MIGGIILLLLTGGLGLFVGYMLGLDHEPRKVAPERREWEKVHDRIWFPLKGKWMLGSVHAPTDPTRQYYKIYCNETVQIYKVASVDLRMYDDVHNEPAPFMSVVELETEMEKNNERPR